jgi:hypothetical protein
MACRPACWRAARRLARRGLAVALAVVCLLAVGSRHCVAQVADAVINREYPLKALFLYNFGSYIEWPSATFVDERQPFVIGVLGASAIEGTLREIAATRTIQGRQIVVEQYASPAALKSCQILFIPRGVGPAERAEAVERLREREVLIVGESPGFALQGAAVNFFIEANKIRFEINVEAAKRHHLKISSKLLALARIVEPTGVNVP